MIKLVTQIGVSFLFPSLLAAGFLVTDSSPSFGACTVSGVKVAGHVVPAETKSPPTPLDCATTGGIGCSFGTPSNLLVEAEVGTGYRLYVLALEIDPTRGVSEISFGIDYDGTPSQGVDVFGWTTCSEQENPENGWPSPGGGNTLTFLGCRGQVPDPDDPEGQSIAVLGSFYVFAYSPDSFRFTNLNYRADPYPRIAACDAETQPLASYRMGYVGFGEPGLDPCSFVADDFPATCCFTDSCTNTQGICCDIAGGEFIGFRPCEDCQVIPVTPSTWGGIKSRYN